MGVTVLTLRLIGVFAKDLRKAYTINELSKRTGKAYANVHATTTRLLNEGVLTKEVIGHSHNCRLNLQNQTTPLYLGLVHTHETKHEPWMDEHKPHLVFQRAQDLLIITDTPFPVENATFLTVNEFLNNETVFATAGTHKLLYGHAHYPSFVQRWSK